MGWFNPFKEKREHELRLAQLQLDNQRLMMEALTKLGERQAESLEKVGEMVKTIADAQQKSTQVLQTWLDGFKVMDLPESSTIRDEDEVKAAVDRVLMADSSIIPPMPDGLPDEFALAWQLKQSMKNEV